MHEVSRNTQQNNVEVPGVSLQPKKDTLKATNSGVLSEVPVEEARNKSASLLRWRFAVVVQHWVLGPLSVIPRESPAK